jgi:hypothetical protein
MRTTRILLGVFSICAALWPVGAFARQGTDCRRPKEPLRKGAINLSGEWMDNSVSRKVKITQSGGNLHQTGEVIAIYEDPYTCAQAGNLGGKPVVLTSDFSGEITDNKVTGLVSICKDVPYTLDRGPLDSKKDYILSEEVFGAVTMIVGADGDSMAGTFMDPVKGVQDISFTRLSENPNKAKYYPQGVIKTIGAATIYDDAAADSKVRYTPPAGTKLIFEEVKVDADGNPTWYKVTNGEGPAYSKNTGWIPASSITCNKPNPKNPGKVG